MVFALDQIEAGLCACRVPDLIAELLEIGLTDLGNFRVVFDQKYSAGGRRRRGG